MKIRSLIEKVIGPMLLFIPMACMHLSDGRHDGNHHSLQYGPSSLKETTVGMQDRNINQSSLVKRN